MKTVVGIALPIIVLAIVGTSMFLASPGDTDRVDAKIVDESSSFNADIAAVDVLISSIETSTCQDYLSRVDAFHPSSPMGFLSIRRAYEESMPKGCLSPEKMTGKLEQLRRKFRAHVHALQGMDLDEESFILWALSTDSHGDSTYVRLSEMIPPTEPTP